MAPPSLLACRPESYRGIGEKANTTRSEWSSLIMALHDALSTISRGERDI
jgi:hypothetical protein